MADLLFMDYLFDRPEDIERKNLMFMYNRLICPRLRSDPEYRIKWEVLQETIAHSKERLLREMRLCPDGDSKAQRLQGIPSIDPVDEWVNGMANNILPTVLKDYDSAAGFDLDAFIDLYYYPNPHVVIMIFPRRKVGEPCCMHTSAIRFSPLLAITQAEETVEKSLHPFILGDDFFDNSLTDPELVKRCMIFEGKIQEALTFSGNILLDLFLWNVAVSAIEEYDPGGRRMVAGGAKWDIMQGKRIEAILGYTRVMRPEERQHE